MKLKNKTVLQLSQAVAAVSQGYVFPAQTRVNLVRNAQLLKGAVDVYEKTKLDLIRRLSPDGTGQAIDRDIDLLAKFNKEHQEIEQAVQEVKGLLFINWTDLDVGNVPAGHVFKLGNLVRGLPAPDAGDVIPDTPEPA